MLHQFFFLTEFQHFKFHTFEFGMLSFSKSPFCLASSLCSSFVLLLRAVFVFTWSFLLEIQIICHYI